MLTLVYISSILIVILSVIFQNTLLFVINNGNVLKTYSKLPQKTCEVLKVKELKGCTQIKQLQGTAYTFAICENQLDAELGEFFNPFKYFGLNKISGELKSYNLKMKNFNKIEFKNLPKSLKLQPVGYGFKIRKDTHVIVDFYIINKAELIGYSVEQFEFHIIHSTFTHVKSIQNPKLLKNPTDLTVIDQNEFLLINSHQQSHGIKRSLEALGAFSGGSIIKYNDGELTAEVSGLYGPKSILSNWDKSLIYVLESFKGKLLTYSRDEEYGDLNLKEEVNLGFMPVSLTQIPKTGELYAVGPTQYHTILANQLANFAKFKLDLPIPFQVQNIKNETSENIFFGHKYQLTEDLKDNGESYLLPTDIEWVNKGEVLLSSIHEDKGALLCKV
ncbi:hypothetical protein CONCODRAFT_70445 [Conidiobolus coronatus NRRL 28638]|uniref:Calcium-dependent phosphotriesterase n=1 Tax=Conidiobolus coronatus (strain ATCC 28846 / CBS 209.66 / NRRL 28638) TaxID=796925 RepID=A0A137P6K6_CONC2|nr:hypothetical protein CONCODRAFT_70445 [Conidiobolus coronatus NRRL 28638]|eukprot:KXN70647.1 hypothetical protein CONCODRAFT_70445 [Conidiobolus coronatus NRRL 28638]